jgi:hypothetical protein
MRLWSLPIVLPMSETKTSGLWKHHKAFVSDKGIRALNNNGEDNSQSKADVVVLRPPHVRNKSLVIMKTSRDCCFKQGKTTKKLESIQRSIVVSCLPRDTSCPSPVMTEKIQDPCDCKDITRLLHMAEEGNEETKSSLHTISPWLTPEVHRRQSSTPGCVLPFTVHDWTNSRPLWLQRHHKGLAHGRRREGRNQE